MKKFKTKLILLLLIIAAFLGGIYVGIVNYNFLNCFLETRNIKKCNFTNKYVNVSIKISEGVNEGRFLDFSYLDGSTALQLLEDTANVITKGEKADAYVTSINGRETDPNKKEFWAFYVNGKMAEVGAGSYILKNGDKIEWKLENY